MRAAALVTILTAAAPPAAADLVLDLPVACTIGQDCFVEDYMDIDPGPAALDYACGLKARDGHRGTDFALPDLAAMQAGVDVLAAAPGVVAAVRDGMADAVLTPDLAQTVEGRECGNAVRVLHAGGWQTLYCHLAQGSVAVSEGQPVAAGTPLGRIGLSGQTSFPHLHFTVLDPDGAHVDPYRPGAAPGACGVAADSLWRDLPPYIPAGHATAGFATDMPTLATVRSGAARAAEAAPDEAIVLYVLLFHTQPGDRIRLRAHGPGGEIFDHDEAVTGDEAQIFRAFGRRAPGGGWPPGDYVGETRLTRDGRLIGARQAYISVASP